MIRVRHVLKMPPSADSESYLRLHNATLEMRRSMRHRKSGEVEVEGCVVRWDTQTRRVTLEGSSPLSGDIMQAVQTIAHDVHFDVCIA